MSDWQIRKLDELAEYINGYGFSSDQQGLGGLPIVRIQNLNDDSKSFNYYDGQIEDRFVVEHGGLLIAWSASLGVFKWNGSKAYVNQHIFNTHVNEKEIDKDFFYYLMLSIIDELRAQSRGSTMKHVTRKAFVNHQVTVPVKTNTQKKIAYILSTLQSKIENIDKQIKVYTDLKKSMMEKLFTEGIVNGYVLDTNIFDRLLENSVDISILPLGKIYITEYQRKQIDDMPEHKNDKKQELLKLLNTISPHEEEHEFFTIGQSMIGGNQVIAPDYIGDWRDELRNLDNAAKKKVSSELGITADIETLHLAYENNFVLITDDQTLNGLARSKSVETLDWQSFITGKSRTQKETEIGMIPESWKVVSVGEICNLSSGGTPSRTSPSYWGGEIRWVKTGEVNYSTIKDTEEYITEEGLRNSSARIFPAGTLLMAMYGQGVTRGKVAMLEVAASTNQACVAIIPKDPKRVSTTYLRYFFEYEYERLRQGSHGAQQMNLSAQIIKTFEITLPKTDEQEEINEALESLEKKLRGLITSKYSYKAFFESMLHKLMNQEIKVEDLNITIH